MPEVSFRVVDISRTNIPSAQGAVMSAAYRSFDDARSAMEGLLGYALPEALGRGWAHGREFLRAARVPLTPDNTERT